MSQADELLNSLTSDELAAYTADSETEPHIVIGADRFITVPDELKRIAVQHDHNIETVTFDCPRYWDGNDLSNMVIYINYMRPDGKLGQYKAENVLQDPSDFSMIHFDWTISKNVTLVNGSITFLTCAKTTDLNGAEILHWNSEINKDLYVSEGLELGDTVVEEDPDVITQLLVRMDEVEDVAKSADLLSAYKYYSDTRDIVESAKAEHEQLAKDIEVERARIDLILDPNGTLEYTETELSDQSEDEGSYATGYVKSNGINATLVVTSMKQTIRYDNVTYDLLDLPEELSPLTRVEYDISNVAGVVQDMTYITTYQDGGIVNVSTSDKQTSVTFTKNSQAKMEIASKTSLSGRYSIKIHSCSGNDSLKDDVRFIVGNTSHTIKEIMSGNAEFVADANTMYISVVVGAETVESASVTVVFELVKLGANGNKIVIDDGYVRLTGVGDYLIGESSILCIPYALNEVKLSTKELEDIRVDIDGNVHNSAGEAVRSQVRKLQSKLDSMIVSVEDETLIISM